MYNRLDTFPSDELIGQYRNVFSSKNGQDVLTHILYDLGVFFETSLSPEDVSLRNYGVRILRILSGGEIEGDNIKSFTMKLMKQPLLKEKFDD